MYHLYLSETQGFIVNTRISLPFSFQTKEGMQMVYHASNQNSAPLEFTMSSDQINLGGLLAVPSETTFKIEIGNTDE